MPEPAPPPAAARGDQVLAGRYRLIRPIASGGMAQVWEAHDAVLGRPVAVKVLHPHLASDSLFVARFRAEAINAARLTHPGIVSIYDTWSGDGGEAIVMELVRGTTLRHLLDARGALPPEEAVTIADHIAAALEVAHHAGIIHRDIKPANVLLSSDGRVLVTDFGIAKAVEGNDLTTERTMLGTAKYLAPEQVEGTTVDGRTDLYALGVVLYEMLTGDVPFKAETETATALARLHRLPDPPSAHRPGLSPSVEALVLWCMARRPGDRPPSAGDLRRSLAAVDRRLGMSGPAAIQPDAPAPLSAPPTVGPGSLAIRPAPPPARHRWPVVVLVLLALAVGGALVGAIVHQNTGSRSVGIKAASAFDPFGRPPGEEHNADAPLAVDGDPATAWATESYKDPGRLGKPGVGLVVRLDHSSRLADVVVESTSANWSASIYLTAKDPGPGFDSWNQPVVTGQAIASGRNRFPLAGQSADAVLIWITRVGDDGVVRIGEVSVTAR